MIGQLQLISLHSELAKIWLSHLISPQQQFSNQDFWATITTRIICCNSRSQWWWPWGRKDWVRYRIRICTCCTNNQQSFRIRRISGKVMEMGLSRLLLLLSSLRIREAFSNQAVIDFMGWRWIPCQPSIIDPQRKCLQILWIKDLRRWGET